MAAGNTGAYEAESILQTIREPLVILSPDLRVVTVNRAFFQRFRIDPRAVMGQLIYEVQDREWDIPKLRSLLEDILPSESSFEGFEVDHDFRSIGRRVMVLNARRVRAEEGAAESILLAIEDVTDRRRAEDERRELETKFASLVRNVRDHAIFTIDLQGKITSWNFAAQRILGFREEEVLGSHFSIIFTEEDQARKTDVWEMDVAVKEGQAEDERWHVRKGGEHFWALGIVTPTYDEQGKQTGYSKILRDMTDRKRAEQEAERLNLELKSLNADLADRVKERTRELETSLQRLAREEAISRRRAERLRELASELTNAEHRQRREIARLLHDHVQQLLVAAKMRVELTSQDIADKSHKARLSEVLAILDDSISATRSLSVDLDPPLLEEEGLASALHWLAGRMKSQHALCVDLDLEENADPVHESHRQILFQAAQELLLNVVKHSGSKEATLSLTVRDDQTRLEVSDRGRGYDVGLAGSKTGSYGLPHLRRRLESIGGDLAIKTGAGGGTRSTATVPR